MCKKVYFYTNSTPPILEFMFESYLEAAKHLSCTPPTIANYVKSGKLFKGKWTLVSSAK